MHESHPGVQDMACDTCLKIVQRCKRKFVIIQVGEHEPFVSELLTGLPTTVMDLEPHQIHSFYESVGLMIQAEPDQVKRDEYLQRLMELPNQKWAEIIGQAWLSVDYLKDQNVIRTVLNILQTNTSVASSLGDYARNSSDTGESEVLSLFATIINKYKGVMTEVVPRIFEAIFECTLAMITTNFDDYPEHRLKFFSLLHAIATFCFLALICLSPQQLKVIMDSIIWAFQHTERNIAETGLNLLLAMLKNFQASELCNQFHQTYFLNIEQEIFAILTEFPQAWVQASHVSAVALIFFGKLWFFDRAVVGFIYCISDIPSQHYVCW
ncbi:hypothetical protein GIB67_021990 [Kingdonia uniflora]|uniref:Exportin-1 C-terminal domain-containing protein n=1 Tax=Kingdonia uniflora TaxID=39325 RepID=A0A7J7P828_9MAGN|nr:hypothetical protein GIB67_021990 [Kingdonia uniflora]